MSVRRILHACGFRYRAHAKELPGTADIVFRPRKKAIFIHGCYWHRHKNCAKATLPKTRREFWSAKFEANMLRDQAAIRALKSLGWHVLIIWECETHHPEKLRLELQSFLAP